MAKLNDLTGKTFGNWYVMYRNGSTKNKAAIWHCRCKLCGTERDVVGASLTSGASTKCRSCVPKQTLSKPHRKTRLYHIYTAMKQRCNNQNASAYSRYGARGISLCDEWQNDPDRFFEWALSNGYNDSLTIDRINNDRGYSPENCRWVPAAEQAKNRSSCVDIVFNSSHYTLTDACNLAGISRDAVRSYKTRHNISYQEAFDHYLT